MAKTPFKHRLNKGRIFYQFGAKDGQPNFKGQMNISGDMTEVTGWQNSDRSIDLRFEPIERAEAIRAKAKERRKKERKK